MPDVSVLTAVYADTPDKVAWLHESVASVREQDFQDVEIIVVDDCSPLDLGELDARVVRTTWRQGPAGCRNTAAALARSDALLALDADDLLPDPGTLSAMYEAWVANPDRVVYGDLQQYLLQNGEYQRARVVNFPPYTFVKVLDPKGLIPVTAMHSKECHVAVGGWKWELEALEDVEYWIAAGAAGFCGLKIDRVVLLYRRHTTSRTVQIRRLRGEGAARRQIREMHEDLYEGRYPMGCCGGGARAAAIPTSPTAPAPTSLESFREDDKVWVRYNGRRTGAFGMVGPATRYTYKVEGTSHVFQVHVQDVQLFRRSGRGQDFSVGVAPPEREPEPAVETEREFSAPAPKLAEIERLDSVAVAQQIPQEVRQELDDVIEAAEIVGLDALSVKRAVRNALEANGWTIQRLATANAGDLTPIRGVGLVTAAKVIDEARELAG